MTQIFDEKRRVVPITVISLGKWIVCQVKISAKDGYAALQLGLLKKKYELFKPQWISAKQKYFEYLREVPIREEDIQKYNIGQSITFEDLSFKKHSLVAVTGVSRGKGFQGVVKRWGFREGPKTHGSNFHRRPGSIGNMCSQGEVIKGKKLPGRAGGQTRTTKGLRGIRVDKENGCIFILGAVPGSKSSLIFICKQG